MMTAVRNILSRSTTQTIVALSLTGVFAILALRGEIGADLFIAQFATVTGFLFGRSQS